MYLRFVVNILDEDSGKRLGLFHVSRELRDQNVLSAYEERQLLEIRDWFNEHLEKPDRFSKSKKPSALGVAISWFKDSATEHIAKMYALTSVLEDHGVSVEVIRTSRPGYIVYEDEFQITAEPYSETKT